MSVDECIDEYTKLTSKVFQVSFLYYATRLYVFHEADPANSLPSNELRKNIGFLPNHLFLAICTRSMAVSTLEILNSRFLQCSKDALRKMASTKLDVAKKPALNYLRTPHQKRAKCECCGTTIRYIH